MSLPVLLLWASITLTLASSSIFSPKLKWKVKCIMLFPSLNIFKFSTFSRLLPSKLVLHETWPAMKRFLPCNNSHKGFISILYTFYLKCHTLVFPLIWPMASGTKDFFLTPAIGIHLLIPYFNILQQKYSTTKLQIPNENLPHALMVSSHE